MGRRSRRLEDQLGHSAAQSGFLTDTNTYEDIGSSISQAEFHSPQKHNSKVRFDGAGGMSDASFMSSELYSSYDHATATPELLSMMSPEEAMDDSTVKTDLTISIDSLEATNPGPEDAADHEGWFCVEGNIITTSKLQSLRKRKGLSTNRTPVASFRTGMSTFSGSRCEWKSEYGKKTQKFKVNGVRIPVEKCHDSQLNRRYLELVVLRADHQHAERVECVQYTRDKALADLVFKGTGGEKKRRRAQMGLTKKDGRCSYKLQVYVTMALAPDEHLPVQSPVYAQHAIPEIHHHPRDYPQLNTASHHQEDSSLYGYFEEGEEEGTFQWSIVGRNLALGVVGGAVLGFVAVGVAGLMGGATKVAAVGHTTTATHAASTKAATATTTTAAKAKAAAAPAKTAAATTTTTKTAAKAATSGTTGASSAHTGANIPVPTDDSPALWSGVIVGGITGLFTSIICTATGTPAYCDPHITESNARYDDSKSPPCDNYDEPSPPPRRSVDTRAPAYPSRKPSRR